MEITRPRTCNGNYTPWDLYCTPWESCGEGAYRNLLFYCRGVLTVLKSIHPRRGKKNIFFVNLERCTYECILIITYFRLTSLDDGDGGGTTAFKQPAFSAERQNCKKTVLG